MVFLSYFNPIYFFADYLLRIFWDLKLKKVRSGSYQSAKVR